MFVFSKFPGQSLWAHWAVTSRQSGDGSCSFPGEAALALAMGFGASFHPADQAGKFLRVLQPSETQADSSRQQHPAEKTLFIGVTDLLQQVFLVL